MAKILTIDDDAGICRLFSRTISRMGHEADEALTLEEGAKKIESGMFDLVLLDVHLPDGNGLEAVPSILRSRGEPEVIIITGGGDAEGAEMATRSGAWAYVEKPVVIGQLMLHIERALQFREQKTRAMRPVVMKREQIVGSGRAITECLEQAALALRLKKDWRPAAKIHIVQPAVPYFITTKGRYFIFFPPWPPRQLYQKKNRSRILG